MSIGTRIALLVIVTLTTIPESTGNCIKKYGHSCMGGHGKRAQQPFLSEAAQMELIRQKYPLFSRIASKHKIATNQPTDVGREFPGAAATGHNMNNNDFVDQLLFPHEFVFSENGEEVSNENEPAATWDRAFNTSPKIFTEKWFSIGPKSLLDTNNRQLQAFLQYLAKLRQQQRYEDASEIYD